MGAFPLHCGHRDTTRDILYRNFLLNDADIAENLQPRVPISGCVVDSVDYSDVDVVQFSEKRSESDGMDVGDVHLGSRRIRMAGTLYGATRPLLFDALLNLRAALSPVLAQREEPEDHGYRPLYFSQPTARIDEFPSGIITQRVLAMPRAFSATFQRDSQGGDDTDALAIPWQATFLQKDPSIQGSATQDYALRVTANNSFTAESDTDLFTDTAHGLTAGERIYFTVLSGGTGLALNTDYYILSSGMTVDAFKVSLTAGGAVVNFTTDVTSGTWAKVITDTDEFVNRGSYLAPLNALINVSALAGTITLAAGDSILTITLPASSGERIVRYDGTAKTLHVEEEDDNELAMSYMETGSDQVHPLISPDITEFTITYQGVEVLADSHIWFYETYA